MNNNEKLALIERVDHASGDQAKRALRAMILKCTVTQSTIARAIKDAVEQHTTAPTIVYEKLESDNDDDATLNSSRQNQIIDKKNQIVGGQEEENVPSTASKEDESAHRDDISAVKKTKTKTKVKRKEKSTGHNTSRPNSPDSSRKTKKKEKKVKHASKHRVEIDQSGPKSSTERLSEQMKSTTIDLITSSEDEAAHTKLSKKRMLANKTSNRDTSENHSPGDDSSVDEQRDDSLAKDVRASQERYGMKTTQAEARNDDRSRRDQSVTVSMAKALNQHDKNKMGSSGLDKKRKALQPTVGETHTNHPAKSTTDVHLVKRPKQDQPKEAKTSSEGPKCENCGKLCLSISQLLKHRRSCIWKTNVANFGRRQRSEAPANDHRDQIKRIQNTSEPPADSLTIESQNTTQLTSTPLQTVQAEQLKFGHNPNGFQRGPAPVSMALPRSDAGTKSFPSLSFRKKMPESTSDVSQGHQSLPSRPESPKQRLIREQRDRVVHICIHCKKSFRECDNVDGSCSFHKGSYRYGLDSYRPLKWAQGRKFERGWTCCNQQEEDAPPCVMHGRHARP